MFAGDIHSVGMIHIPKQTRQTLYQMQKHTSLGIYMYQLSLCPTQIYISKMSLGRGRAGIKTDTSQSSPIKQKNGLTSLQNYLKPNDSIGIQKHLFFIQKYKTYCNHIKTWTNVPQQTVHTQHRSSQISVCKIYAQLPNYFSAAVQYRRVILLNCCIIAVTG